MGKVIDCSTSPMSAGEIKLRRLIEGVPVKQDPRAAGDQPAPYEQQFEGGLPEGYVGIMRLRLAGIGEMDAVVLTPHAIYVVEDKGWKGPIRGDASGWQSLGIENPGNPPADVCLKAQKLKTRLEKYYDRYGSIWVESCVTLSCDPPPDISGVAIDPGSHVMMLPELDEFVRDRGWLQDQSFGSQLLKRFQPMLRRALLQFLRSPEGLILKWKGGGYEVQGVAYPHNRYMAYRCTDPKDSVVILKCYALPENVGADSEDLQQFVDAQQSVMKRYQDALAKLDGVSEDEEGARYVEAGEPAFIDKKNRLYVVPTRWREGDWALLSARYENQNVARSREVARQLCLGLQYAHRQHIVHRNLSLDSVLVSESGTQIIDWDFAIFLDPETGGQKHGTTLDFLECPEEMKADLKLYERYLAPELRKLLVIGDIGNQTSLRTVAYAKACPETDRYSLGVLLYEVLTRREFDGVLANAPAILRRARVDDAVIASIMTLCGEDASQRTAELVDELARQLDPEGGAAHFLPQLAASDSFTFGEYCFEKPSKLTHTNMSLSYRMEQTLPECRKAVVKFLKRDSIEEARTEQEVIGGLLSRLEGRFTPRWICGGVVNVTGGGRVVEKPGEGETKPRAFMGLEYIEGEELEKAIWNKKLTDPDVVLRVGMDLLRAVKAVHDAGWVHYDLKPDNVILVDGWRELLNKPDGGPVVRLIDFDSAHAVDDPKPHMSSSPNWKTMEAYNLRGEDKYQVDLNSVALVIAAMLCKLGLAPEYRPLIDLQVMEEKAGERVFPILRNMTESKPVDWKYKRAGDLLAALEEAMKPPEPPTVAVAAPVSKNEQEVREAYHAIHKRLKELREDVLGPILARVESPGFAELNKESAEYNTRTRERIAEARDQIADLKRAVDRGERLGLGLAFNEAQLTDEWDLIDLKRRLAWGADRRGDSELEGARTEAEARRGKGQADNLVERLLEQATKRQVKQEAGEEAVSSVPIRALALQELLRLVLEGVELDPKKAEEIQNAFDEILRNASTFIGLGLSEVRDSRNPLGYVRLEDYGEYQGKIRAMVRQVFEQVATKATEFKARAPRAAKKRMALTDFFERFLDEKEEAGLLRRVRELRADINTRVEKWDEAQASLTTVDGLLEGMGEQSSWLACDAVRHAFEAYPEHDEIGKKLKTCVDKIRGGMIQKVSQARAGWENEVSALEAGLTEQEGEWSGAMLINYGLPSWFSRYESAAAQEAEKGRKLAERLRASFGEKLAAVHAALIDAAAKDVVSNAEIGPRWLDGMRMHRAEIRAKVRELQELAASPTNVKVAEAGFGTLSREMPGWLVDPEIKALGKYIVDHLDVPGQVRLARVAFTSHDWAGCVAACERVRGMPECVELAEWLDESFVEMYLESMDRTVENVAATEFVPAMKQLAILRQAGATVEALWPTGQYDEAEEWLKKIEKYGRGESEAARKEKERVQFEERLAECKRRREYGEQQFILERRLNERAGLYGQQVKETCAQAAATATWMQDAGNLLEALLAFDAEDRSLWVGRRGTWLLELRRVYLANWGLFVKELEAQAAPAVSDLGVALAGLRMARTLEQLPHLDEHYRRWVVLTYFSRKAQAAGNDLARVVMLWREAVAEIPGDSELRRLFDDARHLCLVAELDAALMALAWERDPAQKAKRLLEQDVSAAPHLFEAVRTLDQGVQNWPMDKLAPEIVERAWSLQRMVDADESLRREPDMLPMVIRDLEQDAEKRKRPELKARATYLAQQHLNARVQEGDRLKRAGNLDDAAKCYLEALRFAPTDELNRRNVRENAGMIRAYWDGLQQRIAAFDECAGRIQAQLRAANHLSVELENVEAARELPGLKVTGVRETVEALGKKMQKLRLGLMQINKFSPASEEWENAFSPTGDLGLKEGAWAQLTSFHGLLVREFGPGHEQVRQLKQNLEALQPRVMLLSGERSNFNQLLPSLEAGSGWMLERCRAVNDAARVLSERELDYQARWQAWEGPKAYKRLYPDAQAGYQTWAFKVRSVRARETVAQYPYWQEGERFVQWTDWLSEFVVPPGQGREGMSEKDYKVDDKAWKQFWEDHLDVEPCLRSDLKAGQIFLGGFLMLALRTDDYWQQQWDAAETMLEQYEQLWKKLQNQNATWKACEYMRRALGPLEAGSDGATPESLATWLTRLTHVRDSAYYVTAQGRKAAGQVARTLKQGEDIRAGLIGRIKELESKEIKLREAYEREFSVDINPAAAQRDAQKQALHDLESYMAPETPTEEVMQAASRLNFSFDEVEERYKGERRSAEHEFLAYGVDLAEGM